jgi:hypothetical protein
LVFAASTAGTEASTTTELFCSWSMQQMNKFHKIISKKMWFVLFNIGTTIYMILFGRLSWDAISLVSYGVALGLINLIAWFSTRRYPDWK